MDKHLKLFIEGIVQGVGFRPYVYNLALSFNIRGYVLNDSRGVTVEAEAPREILADFWEYLMKNPPPLADIKNATGEITDTLEGYKSFDIRESRETGPKSVLISPDIATCEECLREMNDPDDPRFQYPFINCTNCGPRFTIIKNVPYDRINTSMEEFKLCDFCEAQYIEPTDRRFHAQPVACPTCGPELILYDKNARILERDNARVIKTVAELIEKGAIIAIKGLGGYHLTVDADNETAVKTLRSRKYREDKSFAVMARDTSMVRRYCEMSPEEEALLISHRRPIVLLKKLLETPLAPSVAPNNNYLGVMLPYVPLQHLLLNACKRLLVMTSGNICEEPICFRDDEAQTKLKGVADYFLVNNRAIVMRTDDSVTRILRGKEYPIRRSRGYAPLPIAMKQASPVPILAVGGEAKNTFCIYRQDQAFVSHHIGDLENLETLISFEQGIEHFTSLFDVDIQVVAHDLHPRYLSTQYAEKLDIEKIPIQHHHAHVASVIADRYLDGEVIGVVWDGVGYGTDGKLWGCEFMKAGLEDFERKIHLDYIPLPGGEQSIREPWRLAVSYLYREFGRELFDLKLPIFTQIKHEKIRFILDLINKNLNSPEISSAGRLFDAVAAIAGIRFETTFEGQAAIEMEMLSDRNTKEIYDFEIMNTGPIRIINPSLIIRGVVEDVRKGIPPALIGGKFHNTAAEIIIEGVRIIHKETGLDRIALSGGVFQNIILVEKTLELLEKDGFAPYVHVRVPTNDGGISLGQAAIAARKWRGKQRTHTVHTADRADES